MYNLFQLVLVVPQTKLPHPCKMKTNTNACDCVDATVLQAAGRLLLRVYKPPRSRLCLPSHCRERTEHCGVSILGVSVRLVYLGLVY